MQRRWRTRKPNYQGTYFTRRQFGSGALTPCRLLIGGKELRIQRTHCFSGGEAYLSIRLRQQFFANIFALLLHLRAPGLASFRIADFPFSDAVNGVNSLFAFFSASRDRRKMPPRGPVSITLAVAGGRLGSGSAFLHDLVFTMFLKVKPRRPKRVFFSGTIDAKSHAGSVDPFSSVTRSAISHSRPLTGRDRSARVQRSGGATTRLGARTEA